MIKKILLLSICLMLVSYPSKASTSLDISVRQYVDSNHNRQTELFIPVGESDLAFYKEKNVWKIVLPNAYSIKTNHNSLRLFGTAWKHSTVKNATVIEIPALDEIEPLIEKKHGGWAIRFGKENEQIPTFEISPNKNDIFIEIPYTSEPIFINNNNEKFTYIFPNSLSGYGIKKTYKTPFISFIPTIQGIVIDSSIPLNFEHQNGATIISGKHNLHLNEDNFDSKKTSLKTNNNFYSHLNLLQHLSIIAPAKYQAMINESLSELLAAHEMEKEALIFTRRNSPKYNELQTKQSAHLQTYEDNIKKDFESLILSNETLENKIRKLEDLQFLSRQTEIETDILKQLSTYYLENKQIKSALQTLKRLSALSDENLTSKMQQILISSLEDETLSPWERMVLFLDFKELLPSFPEGKHLLDIFISDALSLDLLDFAFYALRQEKDYHSAAVICLMNKKPALAMAVLQKAPEDEISKFLINEAHRQQKKNMPYPAQDKPIDYFSYQIIKDYLKSLPPQ